ncbi:MAG: arginine--tRNA ligase [Candidatus Hydrogenedentota bacterium]
MSAFANLKGPILEAFPQLSAGDLSFHVPPNLELGDVALRTFEAARKAGMAPAQFAARIAIEINFGPDVQQVTPAGPYANFRISRGRFARAIVGKVLQEGRQYGSTGSGVGKTALVEHTSINPNASPHVGRARNAMIGDSLVRLLKYDGYEVEVHYYVNDIGRQIALLVLVCDKPESMNFDDMLRVYADANARAEHDPEFAAAGYELLARIEEGDAEVKKRFHAVTEMCLRGQVAVLSRLGIHYDVFDRESDFVKDPRLESVLEALRARDALFVDEESRTSVDLEKLGHPYKEGRYVALLRSNGSSMYCYRDLAYTIDKLERKTDLNLIVLGEDHRLYMQQLALILEAAGKHVPEQIYYAYILLKEGKMSTRQGQVVLLSDFLDEATARAAEKVNEQCKDLADAERQAIAGKVAVGAIRFAILRVNSNKNVIFDWDSSLSFTGDTGPYVQYSCARIASILRKHGQQVPSEPMEEFPTETNAEWALTMKIAAFPDIVASAVAQRSVAPIGQYAIEAAHLFTSFYHECPVLDAPSEAHRLARLQLCSATRQTLSNALYLLGVEALDRM